MQNAKISFFAFPALQIHGMVFNDSDTLVCNVTCGNQHDRDLWPKFEGVTEVPKGRSSGMKNHVPAA